MKKSLKDILTLNLFHPEKYIDEDTQLAMAHYNLLFRAIFTIGILGGALIVTGSKIDNYLNKKFPNYNSIQERQRIQLQNQYRKQFHELDKNPPYNLIDSTEFIYRD